MASKAIDSEQHWGGDPAPGPARTPRKRTGLWIGLGIGVALLLAVTCVGGTLGLMFLGFGIQTAEIEEELRSNETLRAEIGALESLEMDWALSLREIDDDVMVYRAKGAKGSGLVHVRSESGDDDREKILWAELELSSGERRELVAAEEPDLELPTVK